MGRRRGDGKRDNQTTLPMLDLLVPHTESQMASGTMSHAARQSTIVMGPHGVLQIS